MTALGYKDPDVTYRYSYKLNSCTADDNNNTEVHVIGIYGDDCYNNYTITVLPRGPITKPIILVLTSLRKTHWIIDTSVDVEKVLYGVSFVNLAGFFNLFSSLKLISFNI